MKQENKRSSSKKVPAATGNMTEEASPAGLIETRYENYRKFHLIRLYREKPSIHGTFARARRAWFDAIRNNRW
jgi:hypothetical protein